MKKWIQFIKFGLVGISNTLISELIYVIVVCLRGHYAVAAFLGFSISVLNAYYWGNKYVFKEEEDKEQRVWWKVLAKTYVAYAGGFVLDLILLFIWIEVLCISNYLQPLAEFACSMGFPQVSAELMGELVAKAVNIVLIVPINFLINKYWAYKQK